MGVFDGHRAVFMFMFSTQAEKSIAAVAQTMLSDARADVLLIKAQDGANWEGVFEPGEPAAITSLSRLQAAIAEGQATGITVVPWVVPHGPGDGQWHAQLGPVLVVDLEPYPQFWTANGTTDVLNYLATLRHGGVTELYVSIDPRLDHLRELDVANWATRVEGLLCQLYWTDFQQREPVINPLLDMEVDTLHAHVYPVLPFNGDPADMDAAWAYAEGKGCTGVVLWRFGAADLAQLQTFGALPLPPPPTPQRVMDNNDIVQCERYLLAEPQQLAELVAYLLPFLPQK